MASAMRSCAAVRKPLKASAWCRRASASAIRSIWISVRQAVWTSKAKTKVAGKMSNGRSGLCPSASVGRRHGRSHHDQWSGGSSVLGGWWHRSGKAAMPGQAFIDADRRSDRAWLYRQLQRRGDPATDLVLTASTQMLRAKKVVGKFVEFSGAGLDHLSLADRATIADMARGMAPPAACSRLMQKPSLCRRRPVVQQVVWPWLKPMREAQGVWRTAQTRPGLYRHAGT